MRIGRRTLAGAVALAAALTAGACSKETPQGGSTPTPTIPTSTPTSPPAKPVAKAIVYADRDDLWLYDVANDSVRRLTFDGDDRHERHPAFKDAETVTFSSTNNDATRSTVYDLNLVSGRESEVTTFAGNIQSFDWSPDDATLAYVAQRATREVFDSYLYTYTPADDASKRVKKLLLCEQACGRGGTDYDEQIVAWSPDGEALIVEDTALDNTKNITLYVVGPDGKDLVPPRGGTQARWAPDSGTVYYVSWSLGTSGRRTFALDVDTGKERRLAVTGGLRLAVSLDGTTLAYDDGKGKAAVYLFDLQSGKERRLATSLVGPLWLTDDALAVTNVRPCVDDECGEAPLWVGRGSTARITDAGQVKPASLTSTVDADVLYG